MINELYQLNRALTAAGIDTKDFQFDPNYREVGKGHRCFKVIVNQGEVVAFSELDKSTQAQLRTYGDNQSTYPCMNLAPLASVKKKEDREFINDIKEHPELLDEEKLCRLEEIFEASESKWDEKNKKRYKNHFLKSRELLERCSEYDRLVQLVTDTKPYAEDIERLRQQLKEKAMDSLKNVTNVDCALGLLFSCKAEKQKGAEAETAETIVVAFESETCEKEHAPVVSADFVREVNRRLLKTIAIPENQKVGKDSCPDAFGQERIPAKKDTMPQINLPGIPGVILRSMNEDQGCQKRYLRTGGETYPLRKDTQIELHAALGWISAQSNEGIFWMKMQTKMLLFCYPDYLLDGAGRNRRIEVGKEALCKEKAKDFLQQFTKLREEDDPHRSKAIRIFIIRKLDKARTKVIYTRQTDPVELEALIEQWTAGCHNLPAMPHGIQCAITHRTITEKGRGKKEIEVNGLDPFEAVDLMNKAFRRDGSEIDSKKETSKHHGIELLMEPKMSVDADLAQLVRQEMKVIAAFGRAKYALSHSKTDSTWTAKKKQAAEKAIEETAGMLALSALLLSRKNSEKEKYMESLPYLFGQLLKASDELHCLYCDVVRDGKLPPELAGGAMVSTAVDAPARALALLGKRMMPYYNWAKSYARKQENTGSESPAEKEKTDAYKRRARWIEKVYRELANQLKTVQMTTGRFNDVEKAQLFIGYFAELDKKNNANCETENIKTIEEEQNNA